MEYSFGLLSTLFAYGFHNENNTCYRSSRVRNTSVITRKWTEMHSMIYSWRVSQELLRVSISFCFLVTSGISPENLAFLYTPKKSFKIIPSGHTRRRNLIFPPEVTLYELRYHRLFVI
ncbi:hypothetical protein GIB67_029134 [Kingdonia uniflora]|uniref:Uncharacterized protein n=1 Tax=Kingdonia uniflora TaxID=39325 RepID=A0A7J7N3T0_9MAGN|nr:hypothetical protein GIB67_029134 [Kingdonia uniflora]